MSIRLAIVGPGRVGKALGKRFAEHAKGAVELLGFVARGEAVAPAAEAVAFCGAGRPLAIADLAEAHAVVFAVGDPDLAAAVAACRRAPPRDCSLWLHTSGRFGLEALDALAGTGARRGALHPVAPFADAASGYRALAGAPAVLLGEPNALALLRRLAELLGTTPIHSQGGDRTLYHAACALAANGVTALRDLVDATFAAAGGLHPQDAASLAESLLSGALRAAAERGPAAALSGPAVRGDAATIAAHLAALDAAVPAAAAAYRSLMARAVELAELRGLPAASAAALRETLRAGPP